MPRTASTGLSLSELQRLVTRRQRDLTKLQKRRAKIQKKLDAIDAQISSIDGGAGIGGRRGGRGSRPHNEVSLPDAIHQVLARASSPMGVGDIADRVRATGYKSNSANFRGIVNQTLIKDKRFTAAQRGLYQVKK